MSAYDQIYKAYTEFQKNNFWDAWGIVASPRVIHELRAECMEHMVVHNAVGTLEKIFGLVVIPYALLDDRTCYVVDEQLGRTILQTNRKERMMRLIDADILPRHGNRGGLVRWQDIEDAPTVDAVEVVKDMLKGEMKLMPAVDIVRCCECKYLKQNRVTGMLWCDRRADKVIVIPDDYCSFGERDEK